MHHETMNVLSSPKVAATVASATAGSGLASWMDLLNDGLGLVAIISGIVLTSILIRKHLFEFKMMKEREQSRRKGDEQ